MSIKSKRKGDTLIVTASGKLGIATTEEFEKAVKSGLDGVKELIIDLNKIEYLASAGLRVILTAAKIMKKQGRIKVINVPPSVMDTFRFTGMTDIMEIRQI